MEASLRRFRAVLFDFDGTLADSFEPIAASVNHVRARHGLGPLTVEEVKPHVGRGPQYLLEHTVPGVRIEEDLACYRAHHPSVMYKGTRLFPGAAAALQALHRAGKLLGLCSNKPRQFSRELLRFFAVADLFGVVLGPEDVALPKPAPEMLLVGLERLSVASSEALYVGDMTVDISTARAAGVTVWVVPTGSEKRDSLERGKPDRILDDLQELAVAAEVA